MSDSTRYDYNIYCQTESKWVAGTTKSAVPPTSCFNNNGHIITASATTLTGTVSPQIVTLAEETTATNGNYKCDGIAFTALAAVNGVPTVSTCDFKYPFPINLLSASTNVDISHSGNSIDVYFVPDTIIGGTTQIGSATSDKTVAVPPLSISSIIEGSTVKITDGSGTQDLGVVTLNMNATSITTTTGPDRAFDKSSRLDFSYITQSGVTTVLSTTDSQIATTGAFIPGLMVQVAGVTCGKILSVDNNVLQLDTNLIDTYAAGSVVSSKFTAASHTTVNAAVADTQLTLDTTSLVPGLQVFSGTTSLGMIASVSATSITIPALASAVPANTTISFSFSCQSVVTVTASPQTLLTLDGVANHALIGLAVNVSGMNLGVISLVSGSIITVTGDLTHMIAAGSHVVFSMAPYTCLTTSDMLPVNIIEVQDSCIMYGEIGMRIELTDFTNLDNLGRIVAVDKINKRITVEVPPTRVWPVGSYVEVTRFFIKSLEFGGSGTYGFSTSRNLGSYVQTGKIGRIGYTNKSAKDVRYSMKLEYLH